jgi:hypothetical protein
MINLTKLTDRQLSIRIAKLRGWKCDNKGNWWHDEYGDGPPPNYATDRRKAEAFLAGEIGLPRP